MYTLPYVMSDSEKVPSRAQADWNYLTNGTSSGFLRHWKGCVFEADIGADGKQLGSARSVPGVVEPPPMQVASPLDAADT